MPEMIHGYRTTFHAYPDIYGQDPMVPHMWPKRPWLPRYLIDLVKCKIDVRHLGSYILLVNSRLQSCDPFPIPNPVSMLYFYSEVCCKVEQSQ